MFSMNSILKKMETIKSFLSARGAEVLLPTNEWEVLRFRAGDKTSVVYRNAQNCLTLTGEAKAALDSFFHQKPWRAKPAVKRTRSNKKSPKRVADLLSRDGDGCFLCGEPMGDDITVEHLVAVTHGGPNHIANMALAHSKCNATMHHLSLMEKIGMREQMIYHRRTPCLSDTAMGVAAASLKSAAPMHSGARNGCEASAAATDSTTH